MKSPYLILALGIQFAAAADLVVTSGVDGDPASLRTLLFNAQSADRVIFSPSFAGQTLVLTQGPLRINRQNVTLDGSALNPAVTISGDHTSNLLSLSGQTSLTVDSIVFTDGLASTGGAIASSVSLTLRRCTFSGNRASSGGAIYHAGSYGTNLLIENCTFDGNVATSSGGAIHLNATGTVELRGCTLTGNTATSQAGAIYSRYPFTCRDSVLAGNAAGSGPADVNSGVLTPTSPSAGNRIGGDPVLALLGNYGGPLPTRAPLAGSPVIDPTSNATSSPLLTDQRGLARVIGPRVDSGAVEHNPAQTFILPANGSTGVDIGTSTASWSIEADADTFEVYLGTTSGALDLVGTTAVGRFDLPLTEPQATYYWRIDALRAGVRTTGVEYSLTTRAVITVTTSADENDGTADPGTGAGTSLREAVLAAKTDPGGDRIQFAPELSGATIVLGGSPLSVVGSLHIDASSLTEGLTISGNRLSSVLKTAAEGSIPPVVKLNRLTLTKANGGAIISTGRLVLNDCRVTGNEGGNSAITAVDLELLRTTISLNRTDSSTKGTVFATNLLARDSTIAANTNPTSSSTIAVQNSGELSNLTISDNIGLGLVKNGSGALQLRQVTLSGNRASFTAGLRINAGQVGLENCVVAGNLTSSSSSNPDLQGTLASQQGFNFIGGDPMLAPLGDYGGPAPTRPPVIGSPLIDPAGGLTASGLPTDQRGYPRVIGGIVDAGAVEFGDGQPGSPADGATGIASYQTTLYWTSNPGADSHEVFIATDAGSLTSIGTTAGGLWTLAVLEPETTYFWRVDSTTAGSTVIGEVRSFTTRPALQVTTASDEDDGTPDPGIGAGTSMREAIAASADTIDADTIRFAPALDGETIVLGGTPVLLADGVFVDALQLPSGLTISANRLSGAVRLPKFAEARLQGLRIRDCERIGSTSGFGVYNEGSLSLTHCVITGNGDSGVFSLGPLVMEDCLVYRNRGTFYAGGIYCSGGTLLRRTTVADNWQSSHGGIVNYDLPLTLEQCTITGNRSDTSISAIYSNGGDVTLRQSTVADNQMGSSSAVTVSVPFATLTIENSIIVSPDFGPNTIAASSRVDVGVNLTSGNPLLAPLGYYGGATPTMPPVAGSPAIDPAGGPVSSEFEIDQRGSARVVGATVDLGAVEFQDDGIAFPNDGAVGVPSYRLPLTWSPVADATSYEVFLGSDAGSLESLGTTGAGLWIAEQLEPGETCFWRVDATTGGGVVTGSVGSFTTRPALLVTTDADEDDVVPDGGTGVSLREALLLAGEAIGGDTIHFDPALGGATLPLNGTTLPLDNPVAIDASDLAQGIAISGAMQSTVLEVSSLTNALLVACTVRDAGFNPSLGTSPGCGIRNHGQLKISRCSVVDNRAKVDGGGIYNDGTLEISNSTIAGNRAYFFGGGISNDGVLSLSHSTVSANYSKNEGAGICDIFATSTISNSIIAGNFHSVDVYGTIESEPIANLIGGDPQLAPLGNYGGPTPTMPPLAGSPAIDPPGGATTSPFTIDQRGQARIVNGLLDIGAVEWNPDPFRVPADGLTGVTPLHLDLAWNGSADSFEVFAGTAPNALVSVGGGVSSKIQLGPLQPETTYYWRIDATTGGTTTQGGVWSFTTRAAWLVTTAVDENDGNADPGVGTGTSLREALDAARLMPGGDLIHFAPSLAGATIALAGNPLEIDDDIRIDASLLESGPVVSAGGTSRMIEIEAFNSVELDGFSLVQGSSFSGGGINGEFGSLQLSRMTLSNHQGGAISTIRSDVTLRDTTVCNNASSNGGGLQVNLGSLEVINSTITENHATATGGGIFTNGSAVHLLHSTVTGNSAANSGGIYVSASDSESYISSIIAGNDATTALDLGGFPQALPVNCLIGVDPELAPLGDYGGRTQTMIPLPGSPAIDAAAGSTAGTDQRGFPITDGSPDIGAVEYRGNLDLALLWSIDFDHDGTPFGIEHALGTDPFVSDAREPGNLTAPVFASGNAGLTFGFNPDAADHTIWILKRSPDLSPGSFEEIYRYDGPSATGTPATDISAAVGAASIVVTDENPPAGKAFYRFEAEIAPAP